MYQPIKLTPKSEVAMMESFSLDPVSNHQPNIFTEAVFSGGKATIKPIEEQFQVIKDLLDAELAKDQTNNETKFDPEKFIKNQAWKELEDRMIKIFGFRNIDIMHWNEKYVSESKYFDSMELNCYTWPTWRYPIDGLVTDKGFYDTSRSINTKVSFSLGIIKTLTAAEITAIFLHELGHNLDPAIVDITYTKVNILSKYLTDRVDKIDKQEQKMIDGSRAGKLGFLFEIVTIVCGTITIAALINMIIDFFKDLFKGPKPPEFDKNKIIKELKVAVSEDKDVFTRQQNKEAFADNFARMYGYGPELMSGFHKTNIHYDKEISSRYEKEQERQKVIATIIMSSLKSSHKTDVHRAYNLIREYEADLKDPHIPAKVKEAIRQDLDELNKILDEFLNSGDDFSNQLNNIILEELKKVDPNAGEATKDDQGDNATLTTESVLFAECIEPYDEKMALVDEYSLRYLNAQELAIVKKLFGETLIRRCTFMHDKHGYFAVNNRARTGFYSRLEDIPRAKVEFVAHIDRTRHYNGV